jgi:Flp pilus assembly protein TadG
VVIGMDRKLIARGRREDGTALIETALVLPLMLFVCIGILEFGRAYQAWQVVTNASREGARVAVLPGMDDTAVTTRVKAYLDAGALEKASVTGIVIDRNTTVSIGGTGTASASKVTVNYPFEFMVMQPVAQLVVSGSTVGSALTMTASTTMRNEN